MILDNVDIHLLASFGLIKPNGKIDYLKARAKTWGSGSHPFSLVFWSDHRWQITHNGELLLFGDHKKGDRLLFDKIRMWIERVGLRAATEILTPILENGQSPVIPISPPTPVVDPAPPSVKRKITDVLLDSPKPKVEYYHDPQLDQEMKELFGEE